MELNLYAMSTLEYGRPRPLINTSLVRTAKLALIISCTIPGTGLAILGTFAVTRDVTLCLVGLFWLFLGAISAITLIAICIHKLLELSVLLSEHRAARRFYRWAVAIALLSFPIAAFCMYAGSSLAEMP